MVITGLTRNQFERKLTRVRIPPSPPELNASKLAGLLAFLILEPRCPFSQLCVFKGLRCPKPCFSLILSGFTSFVFPKNRLNPRKALKFKETFGIIPLAR